MTKRRARPVVFQPTTSRGMQRGINQIVDALRPTLGPRPRTVAIEGNVKGKVELLDSGGVIARRIIELPDRDADVGAMFLRQMLWQVHEDAGDGTATAAVLFEAIFNEGVRYLTAGGNAQRLRRHLEAGLDIILDTLTRMTVPVEGREQLAHIARSVCYDAPLAGMLGEIFDIIGEFGRLELRKGQSRELVREYVEGMFWDRGLMSREMILDRVNQITQFENAAILISDLSIDDPRDLVPALTAAYKDGLRALLIVAGSLSSNALGFLIANNKPDRMRLMAVKAPEIGDEQPAALMDLAMLTGGRPFLKAAGDTLRAVNPEDLGRARRAWADTRFFGIVGGKGDPRALRRHIADLRAAYQGANDPAQRQKLRKRIGKLMGGSATLWVGAATDKEVEARKELAERTAEALRGALMAGVVPGGGVALLACQPALEARLHASTETDAQAAYRMLLKALEAPARTIIANAGYEASAVIAEVKQAGPGCGFDVVSGRVVDMAEAGIFDVAPALKAAAHGAIASAALALTVDVMVHKRKRETRYAP